MKDIQPSEILKELNIKNSELNLDSLNKIFRDKNVFIRLSYQGKKIIPILYIDNCSFWFGKDIKYGMGYDGWEFGDNSSIKNGTKSYTICDTGEKE